MDPNPLLGVTIFVIGGLAGAIFYLPFKKVQNWAWESYWLVYAVVGLVVVPWALALTTSPNVVSVLQQSPPKVLGYCFLCGALWGFGGMTWGLMIRYLGVGLGLALGCGLCSAGGTLIPPILNGNVGKLYETPDAKVALLGVLVSLAGIITVGMAGMSKENELPEEEKKKAVAEYNFKKGILIAIFSGLMSAALNFGLQGGSILEYKAQYGAATKVIKSTAKQPPQELGTSKGIFYDKEKECWVAPVASETERLTSSTWRGMPVLVIALAGGFSINLLLCLYLNAKNKTFSDYMKSRTPLMTNFLFAGLAGAIWCSQFICMKTGEPAMGEQDYIGWAVLMGSAILFSTLLGIVLGEWKGTSGRTRGLLAVGLLLLLGSAGIAAYSGDMAKQAKEATPAIAIERPAAS